MPLLLIPQHGSEPHAGPHLPVSSQCFIVSALHSSVYVTEAEWM